MKDKTDSKSSRVEMDTGAIQMVRDLLFGTDSAPPPQRRLLVIQDCWYNPQQIVRIRSYNSVSFGTNFDAVHPFQILVYSHREEAFKHGYTSQEARDLDLNRILSEWVANK